MPTSLEIAPTIASPGALQPTAIQSDTFTGGAKPPIDHNLSNLADSLGHFNTGLQRFARAAGYDKLVEDKQAEAAANLANKQEAERRLTGYMQGTTPDQQWQDAVNGKVDFSTSPFTADLWHKTLASLAGQKLSQQISDQDSQGKIPYGDPHYNYQVDLLHQARDVRAQLGDDPSGVLDQHFNQAIESIRVDMGNRHRAAFAKQVQDQNGTAASLEFQDAFAAGVKQNMNGQQLSDAMDAVKQRLGPGIGGGDFGLAGHQYDKLQLAALQKAAQDPDTAQQAVSVLDAKRTAMDGKTALPSLGDNPNHSAAVEAIRSTAFKVLGKKADSDTQAAVASKNIASFDRADGSIGNIKGEDAPLNPLTGAPVPKMGPQQQIDAAAKGWLAKSRANDGGNHDYEGEFDKFSRNDVKHPELFDGLQRAVAGLGGQSGAGPEAAQAMDQAANRYQVMMAKDSGYTSHFLDKGTKEALDQYTMLTKDLHKDPTEATAIVQSAKAMPEEAKAVNFSSDDKQAILDAVNTVKPDGVRPLNKGMVQERLQDLTKAFMLTNQLQPQEAIKLAVKNLNENLVTINGAAVRGASIAHADVPAVQSLLKSGYEANKELFNSRGVTGPEQLSVQEMSPGLFHIRGVNGDTYSLPSANGRRSPMLSTQQIQSERNRLEAAGVQKLRDQAAGIGQPKIDPPVEMPPSQF